MYLEYLLLVFDYFKTLNRKNCLFEIVIPFFIGLAVACCSFFYPEYLSTSKFFDNSINIIGVLLGFTLAIITFFVASDNKNIENTKKHLTNYIVGNEKISLYRLLIDNYSYLIIIETIICLGFLIGGLFYFILPLSFQIILKSIYVVLVIHILLITIRSVTDLYFILIKK